MSTSTIIAVPAFLQEMALQLNLLLTAVVSTKLKYSAEIVTFAYTTLDHQFELGFDFEVRHYQDGDEQVFKTADIELLTSVKMQTLSNDKALMFGGNQLKKTTKQKLTRLVEEFVGSKVR